MMRAAGATEVHRRIASPPTTNPCFYGVDTPDKDQLIAEQKSIAEITTIGADPAYLDCYLYGPWVKQQETTIIRISGACFTGDYPIKLASGLSGKRVSHGNSR